MTAANTDKLRKVQRKFSTTLSSTLSQSATTAVLSSASGLPTDTAVTITIDRVDSNGTATPSAEEVVTGVVSGNNVQNLLRGREGTTDQAHNAGAVVEMVWTETIWNDAVDAFLVEHNQDGTLKDDAVVTANITDDSVTTAKIADDAVTAAKIPDASITPAKIDYPTIVYAEELLSNDAITADTAVLSVTLTVGTWLVNVSSSPRVTHNASHNGRITLQFGNNPGTITERAFQAQASSGLSTGGSLNISNFMMTATGLVTVTAEDDYSIWFTNISNSATLNANSAATTIQAIKISDATS